MRSARRLPVNRAWAGVIQCLAFVRKELVSMLPGCGTHHGTRVIWKTWLLT